MQFFCAIIFTGGNMSYKYKEIWDINLPENYEGCKYYDGWLEEDQLKR